MPRLDYSTHNISRSAPGEPVWKGAGQGWHCVQCNLVIMDRIGKCDAPQPHLIEGRQIRVSLGCAELIGNGLPSGTCQMLGWEGTSEHPGQRSPRRC